MGLWQCELAPASGKTLSNGDKCSEESQPGTGEGEAVRGGGGGKFFTWTGKRAL